MTASASNSNKVDKNLNFKQSSQKSGVSSDPFSENVKNQNIINSLNQLKHSPSTKLIVHSKAPEKVLELTKKVNKDDNCSIKSIFDASDCRENMAKTAANCKVKDYDRLKSQVIEKV